VTCPIRDRPGLDWPPRAEVVDISGNHISVSDLR
jgi:hypothetical protein